MFRLTKRTTPCCPTVKNGEGEDIPTSNHNCLLERKFLLVGLFLGLFVLDGGLLEFVLAIGEFDTLV
jgi:hypothetical protein